MLFIVLYKGTKYADVAELADSPDLGSGISDVQVQVLSSAPKKKAVKRPLFVWQGINAGLEAEAVLNDSPVDCLIRVRTELRRARPSPVIRTK